MSVTLADPLDVVWAALEARDCRPRGERWKVTAHCPAHPDRRPSLSVAEGADRRVLVSCFAGCEPEAVIDALGLRWPDLFPAGHRKGPRPPRRHDLESRTDAAVVLDALKVAGYRWNGVVALERCPFCDAPHPWVRFTDAGGVEVQCTDGCHRDEVLRALEARVAIAQAGR